MPLMRFLSDTKLTAGANQSSSAKAFSGQAEKAITPQIIKLNNRFRMFKKILPFAEKFSRSRLIKYNYNI